MTRWRGLPPHPRLHRTPASQGKTDREIRRCLKRYIARELFRALNRRRA